MRIGFHFTAKDAKKRLLLSEGLFPARPDASRRSARHRGEDIS
jgi:hypothetical protein